MNLPLVFRYFVHNHRRTVVGIQILSIGIIAISGTIQMVNVLSSQIDNFAVIPTAGGNERIAIEPEGAFFTPSTVQAIMELSEEYNMSAPTFLFKSQAVVKQGNLSFPIPFTVTNISQFLPSYFPVYNKVLGIQGNNSGLYIDRSSAFAVQEYGIDLSTSIEIFYSIENETKTLISYVYSTIDNSNIFGLLIDISKFDVQGWNSGIIYLNEYQRISPIVNELRRIEGVVIVEDNGKNEFITESAKQIINILYALYIMISLLSFLSITVLIKTIIDESWHEIKVFRSLGFSTFQISLIFVGQASLIGLIGSLFGIAVSFLLVNSAFSILTIFGIGTFIPPQLYFTQGIQRILESQVLTITASAIPVYSKLWRR